MAVEPSYAMMHLLRHVPAQKVNLGVILSQCRRVEEDSICDGLFICENQDIWRGLQREVSLRNYSKSCPTYRVCPIFLFFHCVHTPHGIFVVKMSECCTTRKGCSIKYGQEEIRPFPTYKYVPFDFLQFSTTVFDLKLDWLASAQRLQRFRRCQMCDNGKSLWRIIPCYFLSHLWQQQQRRRRQLNQTTMKSHSQIFSQTLHLPTLYFGWWWWWIKISSRTSLQIPDTFHML